MSSLQSDFRRLMSENETIDEVVFAITDQKLDDMFFAAFKDKVDYKGEYYALSLEDFEDFQDFVFSNQFNMADDVKIVGEMEEMSVTGGGEAYLPGLDVPAKKYKYGYTQKVKEDANSGYTDVKGFRAGHTKDKGGFIYKDLWNLNEDQFNEIISREDKDKVEKLLAYVKDKAPDLYRRFLGWMSEPYPHDYDEFAAAAGINEREETEKEEFKIGDKVEIVGKWPDKSYGQVISFDDDLVAVNVTKGGGSTFSRRMMIPHDQLRLQNSEIKKQEKKEKKKEKKEMEKEPIKEGLKTEIKVRSKKQQFQEATKMVNKKLKEINTILEFAQGLKTDLQEVECNSCSRMMENMKHDIAEVYKKMKTLAQENDYFKRRRDDDAAYYGTKRGANDPIAMAMRAKKDAPKPSVKKANPNQDKISMLLKKKAEIERDMEQEAEPEGGPIADKYGDMLNKVDKAIAKLRGQGEWGPETNPYMDKDEIERRTAILNKK